MGAHHSKSHRKQKECHGVDTTETPAQVEINLENGHNVSSVTIIKDNISYNNNAVNKPTVEISEDKESDFSVSPESPSADTCSVGSRRSKRSRLGSGSLFGSIKGKRYQGVKVGCRRGSSITGEDFADGPSSLEIRQQQIRQLEDARPKLTDTQLDLIVRSWAVAQKDIAQVGGNMFTRLFESYPEVRERFGPLNSLSPKDIIYQNEIRKHGVRVLKTVEQVVNMRSEDPEKTIELLHDLGSRHIAFSAKVDYIDLLGQHFLFAIEPVLKDQWTPDVEQAWGTLFQFIAHVMKEAMIL